MTRPLLLLLVVAGSLLATTPTDSVTITDTSGSTQTSRPVTFGRFFAKGEIANYAQPLVNGSSVTTWQVDGKTTWNNTYTGGDGSAQFQIISLVIPSISANGSVTITFQNNANPCSSGNAAACASAALTQSGMTGFNSGAWDADIEATQASTTKTTDAKTIIGAGKFTYWLQGPVVTQVIAEDASTSRAYDFGWKDKALTSIVTSGNISSSATSIPVLYGADIAGLTLPTVITAGKSSEQMQVTAVSSNTLTVVRGYNSTTAVSYNPGDNLLLQSNSVTSPTWENAPNSSYTSIHPRFIVTFYPAYTAGVKIDAIIENNWITLLQDQTYNVVMKSGSSLGTTAYSQTAVPHWAKSRWRQTFWSGTAVGSVVTDLNLPYMAYSGAVPNFDTSLSLSASTVTTEQSNWTGGNMGTPFATSGGYAGLLQTGLGNPGASPQIGIIPDWAVLWLYSMGNATNNAAMWNIAKTMADVQGQIPWHYRESSSSYNYLDSTLDPSHTYNAMGHPVSVDARPLWSDQNPGDANQYAGATDTPAIGNVGCSDACGYPNGTQTSATNSWQVDIAHHPDMAYIVYLATGDYYWLEEQYFIGAWLGSSGNPTCGYNDDSCGADSIVSEWALATRGMGWAYRSLGETAAMAPNGTPERSYFQEKFNNNVQVREGMLNIQNGHFYNPNAGGTSLAPCPSFSAGTATMWCLGYMVYTNGKAPATPAFYSNPLTLPFHWQNNNVAINDGENLSLTAGSGDGFWMYWYAMNSWNHDRELGLPSDSFLSVCAKLPINLALNPAVSPGISAAYRQSGVDASKNYFTDWATWYASMYDSGSLTASLTSTDTTIAVTFGSSYGTSNNASVFHNESFVVRIDNEDICVAGNASGVTENSTGETLPAGGVGCLGSVGRGYNGTTATTHSAGATVTLASDVMPHYESVSDDVNGYGLMFHAVLAGVADYSDGSYTGLNAFNHITTIMPSDFQSTMATMPKYAILPRNNVVASIPPPVVFSTGVTRSGVTAN